MITLQVIKFRKITTKNYLQLHYKIFEGFIFIDI